jgi:TRAP-type C4-dicarboxylate transport system substrate-binding protein
LVSRRALDALPAALQQEVRNLAARAETRGYELSAETWRATEATLGQRGMQVLPAPEEFLAGLRRVSAQMTEEWVGRAGEDGKALIEAYRRA